MIGDYVRVRILFDPAHGLFDPSVERAEGTLAVSVVVDQDGELLVRQLDGRDRRYNKELDTHLLGATFFPETLSRVAVVSVPPDKKELRITQTA